MTDPGKKESGLTEYHQNIEVARIMGSNIDEIFKDELRIIQNNPELLRPNPDDAFIDLTSYPLFSQYALNMAFNNYLWGNSVFYSDTDCESRGRIPNSDIYISIKIMGEPKKLDWETIDIKGDGYAVMFMVKKIDSTYTVSDRSFNTDEDEELNLANRLNLLDKSAEPFSKKDEIKLTHLFSSTKKESKLITSMLISDPKKFKQLFNPADMIISGGNRLNTRSEYEEWLKLYHRLKTQAAPVGRIGFYSHGLASGWEDSRGKKYILKELLDKHGNKSGSKIVDMPVEVCSIATGEILGYRLANIRGSKQKYRTDIIDLRKNMHEYLIAGNKL